MIRSLPLSVLTRSLPLSVLTRSLPLSVLTRSLPLLVLTRLRPCSYLVHYCFVNFLLRHTRALRHFERMIAAFDHIKRCGQAMFLYGGANFIGSSKRIA